METSLPVRSDVFFLLGSLENGSTYLLKLSARTVRFPAVTEFLPSLRPSFQLAYFLNSSVQPSLLVERRFEVISDASCHVVPGSGTCLLVHTWCSMQWALARIELHYAAQLTVWPVRGFENGDHHFPAAESALLVVLRARKGAGTRDYLTRC